MPELRFENQVYQVDDFDTVLNTLLKNGHAVPNFCRSGICHSCMMKAEEGEPLAFTQIGLSDELVSEKHFLTCQCAVYTPMSIRRPDKEKRTRFVAMVKQKQNLSDDVVRIELSPEHEFVYEAGQYTTLINVDGLAADYTIASVHGEGERMVFHVEQDPQQPLNEYIVNELDVGDALEVQTALGNCYYGDRFRDQNLLLVALNTAMAGALSFAERAARDNSDRKIELIGLQSTVGRDYFNAACREELTCAEDIVLTVLTPSGSTWDELAAHLGNVGDSTAVLIAATDAEATQHILSVTGRSCYVMFDSSSAAVSV